MLTIIDFKTADPLLDWSELTQAIRDGHDLPKAKIGDLFLENNSDTMLTRAAWIDGLGNAVKVANVFPGRKNTVDGAINGAMAIFDNEIGSIKAFIDFHLVTKWKTVGDSLLASQCLARSEVNTILIVGAGTVASALIAGYGSVYKDATFKVWNRTYSNAVRLAKKYSNRFNILAVEDLESAVRSADIISCATMSSTAIVKGIWLSPGSHLDLIGAYRPDMREADDDAFRIGKIFVDSRQTTINHIGELIFPIERSVITKDAIIADFYDLSQGKFCRSCDDEITVFKNGGGAHLDLMTAVYILRKWKELHRT